ncbi:nuclear transport factor 2 family protein [Lentzea sp. DG1S-22]|uniref:nuclear transport factor 2 family protein n=1 Tax=Lentzea sp. DG1S-22 TaxID=3108822 RepID=UPI002E791554|nr:nuclear transport factor 2 family protein [Lentzea sp. DG1S-22]WVH82410.1 nuclear transport factor 2 family protein [Lentzea sp. DG1S-22]
MLTPAHRHEIENTLHRWALGYDNQDAAMLTDCLTEDAELTMSVGGAPINGSFAGREAILELARATWHHQEDRRRHVLSNVIVEHVGDGRAWTTSYLTIFSIRSGAVHPLSIGQHHDELTWQDGGWRISKRRTSFDLPY